MAKRKSTVKAGNAASPAMDKLDVNDQSIIKKDGKLAVRVKENKHISLEIPIPTPIRKSKVNHEEDEEGDVFKTPMERRHITFDDSDNDEFVTPSEAPSKNPLEAATSSKKVEEEEDDDEEEEDDESDDEAPEAISTQGAEQRAREELKAASKAAEKKAASERRKRQERDAFLKQQAEEKKRARQAAEEAAEPEEPSAPAPEKRKREVPKLLPLELLDSDDEDDVAQQLELAENGKQKRRKLGAEETLVREPKRPKDKKVGSTVFRVAADRGDQNVAPKVNKQSVRLREEMLRRGRIPQQKRGFFVK